MVGVAGFEPAAHWSQTSCATKLRYTPINFCGGEDGIRTHAALANPNDLANRPLQPLEYFSLYSFVLFRHLQFKIMAERVGFEPTAPFGVTGFQDQLLKPLGHLSIMSSTSLLDFLLLKNGDPSEARTPDTLIKSQVLCRLS